MATQIEVKYSLRVLTRERGLLDVGLLEQEIDEALRGKGFVVTVVDRGGYPAPNGYMHKTTLWLEAVLAPVNYGEKAGE